MRFGGNDGVGGFMEELPALLVVLVAISVFVAGVASAYAGYVERSESLARRDRCQAFVQQALSEPSLLHDSRQGLFDWGKVSVLSNSDFTARFPTERAGFNYSIELRAIGNSTDSLLHARFGFDAPSGAAQKVAIDAPCNILTPEGRVEPAIMGLVAWGFAP
ncbi:MAG: hypothetical protein HZB92_01805 [Euryarchaeota archaeon]|nr:hypothetical protein [Euryarchaeota archaeon]